MAPQAAQPYWVKNSGQQRTAMPSSLSEGGTLAERCVNLERLARRFLIHVSQVGEILGTPRIRSIGHGIRQCLHAIDELRHGNLAGLDAETRLERRLFVVAGVETDGMLADHQNPGKRPACAPLQRRGPAPRFSPRQSALSAAPCTLSSDLPMRVRVWLARLTPQNELSRKRPPVRASAKVQIASGTSSERAIRHIRTNR